MKIIYVPTGKEYNLQPQNMRDIIDLTDSISTSEFPQHKRWIFCVNDEEREIVITYHKQRLSLYTGVPSHNVTTGKEPIKKVYFPEIGSIELR